MGTISEALEKSQTDFDYGYKKIEGEDTALDGCDLILKTIAPFTHQLEGPQSINKDLFPEEYQK